MDRLRLRAPLVLCAAVSACLVAACGGGGATAPAVPSVPLHAGHFAVLPDGYTARVMHAPAGGRFPGFRAELGNPRRMIDSQGRVIGIYRDALGFDHAMFDDGEAVVALTDPTAERTSHANALNDHGLVAGTVDDRIDPPPRPPRAFAWSAALGLRFIADGQTEPASSGEFVTDDGYVIGRLCQSVVQGILANCTSSFAWSAATGLTRYDGLQLRWANNRGDMLGLFQPPGCNEPLLGVMTRAGRFTLLPVEVPASAIANLAYLADDGTVLLETLRAIGTLRAGAVAVQDGVAQNIGRGVAEVPAGATVSSQETTAVAASRAGHAVGVNVVGFTRADGTTGSAFMTYLWTPRHGARPVKFSDSDLHFNATSVNRSGTVVGYAGDGGTGDQRAAIWSSESGGLFLHTLLPAPTLHQAWVAGDAGHVLATALDGNDHLVLTPTGGD